MPSSRKSERKRWIKFISLYQWVWLTLLIISSIALVGLCPFGSKSLLLNFLFLIFIILSLFSLSCLYSLLRKHVGHLQCSAAPLLAWLSPCALGCPCSFSLCPRLPMLFVSWPTPHWVYFLITLHLLFSELKSKGTHYRVLSQWWNESGC